MTTRSTEERFHSLDALRAFALLLGVVFHAAESFEAGHYEWAIVDSSPSSFLNLFRHASHAFRMEIFFLLSGFFARLLYHRRGWRGFTWNRVQRILIPLVIGWMILYPILVFLWITGAVKAGNWQMIPVPVEARSLPPWKLTIGFFMHGGVFQLFDLTHLWFLHQLLVLYAMALALRAVLVRAVPTQWLARLDAVYADALTSRWRWLLLSIPTIPMLLAMRSWSVDTPKESLWPHLPTTVLYGWFFLCGWLLHRQPSLLKTLVPGWRRSMMLGLVLVIPTAELFGWAWRRGWVGTHFEWVRIGHATLYALMMWAFVIGFAGLFIERCPHASRFWRYVADASYWVYLVHLPTVVALQIAVAHVHWHWTIKFPLIVLIAVPLLFISYHVLVRSTFIGRQLNGRSYPVELPWRGIRATSNPRS